MKNKKLIGLLIGLVCVAVILILVLVQCSGGEKPAPTTEPEVTTTEPETTAPETTEAETTVPETTGEETTEPETTAPEVTQPSNTQKPSESNGTGGGYDPGDPDATEPPTTEPAIEVPAAGSEQNPYYEVSAKKTASFNTVKLEAGESVHYVLQTPGAYLFVEDGDLALTLNDSIYSAQDGSLKVELPGDPQQAMKLVLTNRGTEGKSFAVSIQDAVGTADNPIEANNGAIEGELESGDPDGVYYSIVPTHTGIFKLNLHSVAPEGAAVNVTVTASGGEAVLENSSGGTLEVPVTKLTPILIGVEAVKDSEGIAPAVTFAIDGYVAQILTWNVAQIPETKQSVEIQGGQSVYYDISGVPGEELVIEAAGWEAVYNGETYAPVDGKLSVAFPFTDLDQIDRVELRNTDASARTVDMTVIHPLGHILNPEILTALDEHIAYSKPNISSYYLRYTAAADGYVNFVLWEDPTVAGATAQIVLTNDTQDLTARLSDSVDGNVSVAVAAGDQVTIHVSVADASGQTVADTVTVKGELVGTENAPIMVQAPGFTADVPAGKTLYYGGYTLANMFLEVTGENVTVIYNGNSYTPTDGKLRFQLDDTSELIVFAIRNDAVTPASYEAKLQYPAGHVNNPAALIFGENAVTLKAGAEDYCYGFTAPRDGMVILDFPADSQWIYTASNLTQDEYGDTQYSDAEDVQTKASLSVKAGDQIQILVNTYDPMDPWSTPAGQVKFQAQYVSGPITVEEQTTGTSVEMLAGERMIFNTSLYNHVLLIKKGQGFSVTYNDTEYTPGADGQIRVEFAASGTEPFTFVIHCTGTEDTTCTYVISENTAGTKGNPIIAQLGTNQVTQVAGGSDLYYSFTSPERVRITITNTSDFYLVVTTNGRKNTLAPGATCTLVCMEDVVMEIVVNTYDPSNPSTAPAGTGSFTMTKNQ